MKDNAEKEQGQRRGHTVWEDIGLTEYNTPTENGNADLKIVSAKWTQKKQHSTTETDNAQTTTWGGTNKKQHAHTVAGPIAQRTNYSCASNYYRSKAPEHCKFPKLQTEDPPKGKMDRDASQNER